jgi:hypothetical protein
MVCQHTESGCLPIVAFHHFPYLVFNATSFAAQKLTKKTYEWTWKQRRRQVEQLQNLPGL